MKKLGIIMMLAIVLTIGGVYATFTYAQGDAAAVENSFKPTIIGKVIEGEKGTIHLTSTAAIEINDPTNTYTTGGTFSGNLKVSFTPNTGADADVVQNGIKLKMTIAITGNELTDPLFNELTDKKLFTFTAETNLKNEFGGDKIKDEITIDLNDYITVNGVKLETEANYDAYNTALGGVTIKITISEVK